MLITACNYFHSTTSSETSYTPIGVDVDDEHQRQTPAIIALDDIWAAGNANG